MVNAHLDGIDRKILFELSANSRLSYRELGRKVRCSAQRVEYRVKQLVKNKVILDFITMVNYAKLGYSYYVLNMSLKNITGAEKEEKLRELARNPKINLLLKGEGDWHISVGFLAKTPFESRELVSRIRSVFEPHVDQEEFFVHVGAHHYPRIFFDAMQHTPWDDREWVSGGEQEFHLEHGEGRIIRALSENAREGTLELARKCGISVPTVRSKIKRLKGEGIIRGFTVNLNPNLVGHNYVRIYIRRDYKHVPKSRDLMMEFFKDSPEVFRVILVTGKFDTICDVRVANDEALREFTRKIRDKFAKMIITQKTFRVYDVLRFNFFPAEKE